MTEREPVAEQSFKTDDPTLTSWSEARECLKEAEVYWLSTVRPDGRPHAMPLLAMWIDGALYFCTSGSARKAKNLAKNPHCVITLGGPDLDLSVEGEARRVTDEATLRRVVKGYADKFGWQATIVDGAIDADGIGEPPYTVFEMTPTKVIGLGKESGFSATRWRFT